MATIMTTLSVKSELLDRCQEVDDEERGDSEAHDQYTVASNRSLCVSVFCRHDTGRSHPKSVLGDYGHIERSSAWIHLIGGVVFALYAGIRHTFARTNTTTDALVTASAAATAIAFLLSTLYHTTAPNKNMAYWTRLADYAGIYFAMSIGGICDSSIATRGFENVATISIIDAPLAAAVTFVFFVVRRLLTPADETWAGYLNSCSVTFGLFRLGHLDLDHASTRQATSFIIVAAYFLSVPQLVRIFEFEAVATIVTLQALSFAAIIIGMAIDNVIVFPDASLSQGKGPSFMASRRLGCVCSSHAIWHIFAVLASVWSLGARESALLF